jgi:hypothetical protein
MIVTKCSSILYVCYTEDESNKIEKDLEEQYQTSLKNKLTGSARHHVGLGFVQPEVLPTSNDTVTKENETEGGKEKKDDDGEPKKRKQDELEDSNNGEKEESCKRSKEDLKAVTQNDSSNHAESENSASKEFYGNDEADSNSAFAETASDN